MSLGRDPKFQPGDRVTLARADPFGASAGTVLAWSETNQGYLVQWDGLGPHASYYRAADLAASR